MALFCQEESWPLMGAFCKGTPTCLPQRPTLGHHIGFYALMGPVRLWSGAELFGLRTKGHWIRGKVFSLFPEIVKIYKL